MLAHWLGQQTNKTRNRNIARVRTEGRVENDALWREWYQQQLDKGLPLDEPPPPEPPDDQR